MRTALGPCGTVRLRRKLISGQVWVRRSPFSSPFSRPPETSLHQINELQNTAAQSLPRLSSRLAKILGISNASGRRLSGRRCRLDNRRTILLASRRRRWKYWTPGYLASSAKGSLPPTCGSPHPGVRLSSRSPNSASGSVASSKQGSFTSPRYPTGCGARISAWDARKWSSADRRCRSSSNSGVPKPIVTAGPDHPHIPALDLTCGQFKRTVLGLIHVVEEMVVSELKRV
jgi:hypothetical protein